MAYATADDLASALGNPRLMPDGQEVLDACLDAAATEIDHSLDRVDPLPDPVPGIVVRTNINRACEWYKAPDHANGGVGFDQIGTIDTPSSGFERHAKAIRPLKQQFGVA